MKKFISSLISVALLAATIVLPASAQTEDYSDHATWEVTAQNKFVEPIVNPYVTGDLFGTGAGRPSDNVSTGGFLQFTYSASEMDQHKYGAGFNGLNLNGKVFGNTTEANYNWVVWEANKDYVVKLVTKNYSAEGVTPTFLMCFNTYQDSVAKREFVFTDITVKGDETQEIIKTFRTGNTESASTGLRMGFGSGETIDGKVIPRPQDGSVVGLQLSSLYIAEEQIAEIKNEVLGSNIITAGGSLKAKAQLVNQLGLTGNIAQEFTYIALDADRTGLVEDISIVPGDDGAYTINVAETVPAGDYVILARAGQSTDEMLLQKGLVISVVEPEGVDWEDHAKIADEDINPNRFTSHSPANHFTDRNDPNVDVESSDGIWAKFTLGTGSSVNYYGVSGTMFYNTQHLDAAYYNWYAFQPNTNYVFKANIKNASAEGITPRFGISLKSTDANGSTVFDSEVVDVTSTTGQKFVATVSMDATVGSGSLGFPDGTSSTKPLSPAGSVVDLEVTSAYFGIEQVAEITNVAPAEVFAGETAEGKVEILNQAGAKGRLDQSYDLLVLNADRTDIAEGVKAIKGANGAYTINVDEDAASGEYVVLATATNTGDTLLQKGATIEVVNLAEMNLNDNAKIAKENINPNRFTSYSPANHFTDRNDSPIDVNAVSGTTWVKYTLAEGARANAYAASGTMLYSSQHLDAAYYNWYEFQPNTNYAISLNLKNMSSEGITPKFGVALRYKEVAGGANKFDFDIVDVTSTTGQEFKTTLTMGNIVSCGSIGFPDSASGMSTEIGSEVGLEYLTAYIGIEQAAEITNAATSSTVAMPGSEISAKAEILNQVGIKGKLNQDIKFMVLDGARAEKIDDITVAKGENGAYTINVPETAEAGNYVVLAMDEDTGLQLGLEFTVVDSFADTAKAQSPANMLMVPNNANHYMKKYGISDIDYVAGNELQYTYATKNLVKSQAVNGSQLPGMAGSFGPSHYNWTRVEADSDYLITFKMKNNSAEGITPKFGVQLTAKNTEGTTYKSWEVVDVTEREDWQEFKAVLHTDVAGDANAEDEVVDYFSTMFLLGFPTGGTVNGTAVASTPEGSVVVIDMASVSITKVAPAEVKVTEVADADVYTLKAEVVNHAGTTEGVSGQNFTWYAMNADRTEVVDGITLTPSADTTTVTVVADETVADGTYSIVAVANDYGMIKGFDYTKAPEVPKEFAVTGTEWTDLGELTVSCEGIPEAGKTIVVYFAKYVAGVFSGAEVKPIEFDGTSETDSKPATFTTGSYDVKAFIWDADMNALVDTPVNY